ncbi:MAG: AgmX/PglI C-terminal domain-containing protein [Deltaproteobacteria bacterium]|nr:AgmX/PglI C-terminal domain-containing protein [Deltaproteobacteria bacterium]
MGTSSALGLVMTAALAMALAACGSPPEPKPSAPVPPSASTVAAIAPPTCLSEDVATKMLSCPLSNPTPPRVEAPSTVPLSWPGSAHVVTHRQRRPWYRPLSSEELAKLVARDERLSWLEPKVQHHLMAADRASEPAGNKPPQWSVARRAYETYLSQPVAAQELHGYARYRLAHTATILGDRDAALAELAKVIAIAARYPKRYGAAALARMARRELIAIFAEEKEPGQAFDTFRKVSGDRPGNHDRTWLMMDDLGQHYLDRGDQPRMRGLYDELIRRGPKDQRCAYQVRLAEAALIFQSGDHQAMHGALEKQLEAHDRFLGQDHPRAAKAGCARSTILLVSEVATAWHVENAGSDGTEGYRDPRQLQHVLEQYEWLLEWVHPTQLDGWPIDNFPQGVRPTTAIRLAHAGLLRFRKRWEECAEPYERVAASTTSGSLRAAAVLGRARCLQSSVKEKTRGRRGTWKGDREGYYYRELRGEEKQLLETISQYLCAVEPSRWDRLGQAQYRELQLVRGNVWFDARWWEQAATAYREVAFDPRHTTGLVAAQHYLESLEAMQHELKRTPCAATLKGERAKLVELHCSGAHAHRYAEACATLRAVGGPPAAARPSFKTPRHRTRGLRVRMSSTSVSGSTNPAVISRILRQNLGRLQHCYEARLRAGQRYVGDVYLRFDINRDGTVGAAAATAERIDDPPLLQCFTGIVKGLGFAQPEGGVPRIIYPLALTLAEGVVPTERLGLLQPVDF